MRSRRLRRYGMSNWLLSHAIRAVYKRTKQLDVWYRWWRMPILQYQASLFRRIVRRQTVRWQRLPAKN